MDATSHPQARGVVAVWHDEEGWGVLDAPETPGGCWAHFSNLSGDGFRCATAGTEASFTFEALGPHAHQDGYRFRAVAVDLDA